MAYKRNPTRSERMAGLSRHILCATLNPAFTAAGQWFERTIDDSANKRLSIPEAFLAADAVLILYQEVASGLVVYPAMMPRRGPAYLPFLARENLMMEGVKAAGDRQALHEKIREHAMETWHHMRVEGSANDLLQRLHADPAFASIHDQIPDKPVPEAYLGRAVQQVDEFLETVYRPVQERYQGLLGVTVETHVYLGSSMLDIRFIREHPDLVKDGPRKKPVSILTSGLLELDERRRRLIGQVENFKALRNKMSREFPGLQDATRQEAITQMQQVAEESRPWRARYVRSKPPLKT